MQDWKLRQAHRCFSRGGLLAYPTEAVYGLGCDPLNEAAVMRLLELKHRPVTKGLILIAASFQQLRPFVQPLPEKKMQPVLASWPGPHTWLLPAAVGVPSWLTGCHQSLAVRVTAHPIAAALCRAFGSPLVSTSANRSKRRPLRNAIQVRRAFPRDIDCVINGPVGGLLKPTPIRDALSGQCIRG